MEQYILKNNEMATTQGLSGASVSRGICLISTTIWSGVPCKKNNVSSGILVTATGIFDNPWKVKEILKEWKRKLKWKEYM